MTAMDARRRLDAVLAERLHTVAAGLGHNATFMRDIEADLAACHAAYVGLAVTEIAVLRAELGHRLSG